MMSHSRTYACGGLNRNGRTVSWPLDIRESVFRSCRGVWTTSLHVQFNEDPRTFRDVYLPSPIGRFMRKTSAEKHALEEAKQWVNDRLLQTKIFDR